MTGDAENPADSGGKVILEGKSFDRLGQADAAGLAI
jgi:hypothetical protein